MVDRTDKSDISFAVTISFVPETGNIRVVRRTFPQHETEIAPDPAHPNGHYELYSAMLQLLFETGVITTNDKLRAGLGLCSPKRYS